MRSRQQEKEFEECKEFKNEADQQSTNSSGNQTE
jgi:hypothetical protein